MKHARSILLTLAIVFGLIWAGPAAGADVAAYSQGDAPPPPSPTLLTNVPDYAWWYGCSPTSAGKRSFGTDRVARRQYS